MKSIQARLQQRIAFRKCEIQQLTFHKMAAKIRKNYGEEANVSRLLKDLETSQKLDKDVLSDIYWKGL